MALLSKGSYSAPGFELSAKDCHEAHGLAILIVESLAGLSMKLKSLHLSRDKELVKPGEHVFEMLEGCGITSRTSDHIIDCIEAALQIVSSG